MPNDKKRSNDTYERECMCIELVWSTVVVFLEKKLLLRYIIISLQIIN